MSHNSRIYNILGKYFDRKPFILIYFGWFDSEISHMKESMLMVKYFTVNLLLVHISVQAITKLDIRMDYYKKGTNIYLVKLFFCKNWSQLLKV